MKKLSLTLLSLLLAMVGFAQSPCTQLVAGMNLTQSGNTINIANTSTLPTGGTNVTTTAFFYIFQPDNTIIGGIWLTPTASYTFQYAGTYHVRFYQQWVDSTGGPNIAIACEDTIGQQVTITGGTPFPVLDCANTHAGFYYNANVNTVTFTNGSDYGSVAPNIVLSRTSNWDFGDGNSLTQYHAAGPYSTAMNTYSSFGTYNVRLIQKWFDSTNNNTLLCSDTFIQQVTVTPPPNDISVSVLYDTTLNPNHDTLFFKVWLIEVGYDSVASSIKLTAVDSLIIQNNIISYMYAGGTFFNKPAGNYFLKARIAPGTTNPGLIPTYHMSTAQWNNATLYINNSFPSGSAVIDMISGTPGVGPGFIGGNVSQGAGKGTNTGIADQLVLLRDISNNVVAATYSDVNGDYSFGNLATGSYTIYPEEMNYQTTPSSTMIIGAGVNTYNSIDFEKNSHSIKPKTTAVQELTNTAFSIYPNPTKGQVHILWKNGVKGEAQIAVTDITGRVVYSEKAVITSSNQINLNNFNQGVYFIKIHTDKGQFTERVVLQ